MKRFVLAWIVLLGGAAFPEARPEPDSPAFPPRPIVFLPQWEPQAQFAGYFMALEKDFYARRGLTVKILCGGAPRSWPGTVIPG
ncbi:MAG: hypothetical protein ACE15F_15760 [bacterium]